VVELKFAEGWTQEITAGNERNDLLNYVSDTHKALCGFRRRMTMDMTTDELRKEALMLQGEVNDRIEENRQAMVQQAADEAAHHLAYAAAFKPAVSTHKPFANLKEMVV